MTNRERFLAGEIFNSPSGQPEFYRLVNGRTVLERKLFSDPEWYPHAKIVLINGFDFDAMVIESSSRYLTHHWVFDELQFTDGHLWLQINRDCQLAKKRFLSGEVFTLSYSATMYRFSGNNEDPAIIIIDKNGNSSHFTLIEIGGVKVVWNRIFLGQWIKGSFRFDELKFVSDKTKGGATE